MEAEPCPPAVPRARNPSTDNYRTSGLVMSMPSLPVEVVAPEVATSDVVIDAYHGVQVADPFRWLEEHQSPRTRAWIDEQAGVSRSYLDALPGRDLLAPRV